MQSTDKAKECSTSAILMVHCSFFGLLQVSNYAEMLEQGKGNQTAVQPAEAASQKLTK